MNCRKCSGDEEKSHAGDLYGAQISLSQASHTVIPRALAVEMDSLPPCGFDRGRRVQIACIGGAASHVSAAGLRSSNLLTAHLRTHDTLGAVSNNHLPKPTGRCRRSTSKPSVETATLCPLTRVRPCGALSKPLPNLISECPEGHQVSPSWAQRRSECCDPRQIDGREKLQ